MIVNHAPWMDAVIFMVVVLGVALPWLWWWGRRIDRRMRMSDRWLHEHRQDAEGEATP